MFCKGDTCNVSGGAWDKKEGNVKEDVTVAAVFVQINAQKVGPLLAFPYCLWYDTKS